ncbi:MAG: hypothetical protein ACREOZ_04165, partial [Gloeomargaritales cyanobacterium]
TTSVFRHELRNQQKQSAALLDGLNAATTRIKKLDEDLAKLANVQEITSFTKKVLDDILTPSGMLSIFKTMAFVCAKVSNKAH